MKPKSHNALALLLLAGTSQAVAPIASRSTFPRYANNPTPATDPSLYKENGYACLRQGFYWSYPHSKMS